MEHFSRRSISTEITLSRLRTFIANLIKKLMFYHVISGYWKLAM